MDAIAAASEGDTVHIAADTYIENLVVDRDLSLIGTEGEAVTVVDGAGVDTVLVVETGVTVNIVGLTLTNGRADGGGLVVNSSAIVTITSCTIRDNTMHVTGGGVSNSGTVAMTNCTVSGNACAGDQHCLGGGIFNLGSMTLIDSRVIDNTAHSEEFTFVSGGGIFNQGPLTIVCSTISGNSVLNHGLRASGGGIFNSGFNNDLVTISNSIIANNSASNVLGVEVLTTYSTGGGIFSYAPMNLINCMLKGNHAGEKGGGIMNAGDMTLTNCTVADNTTTLTKPLAYGYGGGILVYGTITLDRCTVAGNVGSNGGGIRGFAQLEHTIVAGNFAPDGPDFDGTLTSQGHNLVGNTARTNIVGDTTGNLLDVDPLFMNPLAGDYSLQSSSPAIDAGAPAQQPCEEDVAGNSRILDGDLDGVMILDIGAYEFSHAVLDVLGTPLVGQTLTVDVNGSSPGMLTFLFVGVAMGSAVFSPFGCLFVDIGAPWSLLNVGSTPVSLSGPIPPSASGVTLVFQALVLGGAGGNLTNTKQITVP
jgi:hypothetical protein